VVDAAGVGAGLWLSYLFVMFYLLVAVGGVTHRDLLFESPVKLPFLSVDLPLKGFFYLGPALFLVMHAYVLLHLTLLAGKVGVFDAELQELIADSDLRARFRRQLPSNIFVQFLAGPREVRTGFMGFMLRLIAMVSLIIGPIALLVLIQLQFLPYHDGLVTWWHRAAVVIDLALLWAFWPAVTSGESPGAAWRALRPSSLSVMLLASLLPVLLVFGIATFPGEWLDDAVAATPLGTLHSALVQGQVDFLSRTLTSPWSNVLVLPGLEETDIVKFDPDGKLNHLRATASLRGRHLEGAVLIGATLRRADLAGAQLQRARLDYADLTGAAFAVAAGESSQLTTAPASLQGASLLLARLQGARLRRVLLQGANLVGAELDGADLERAQLQGADLDYASLRGASLVGGDFRAATFSYASLQGAECSNTDFRGAAFYRAQLQGVDLSSSHVRGAEFLQTFVWRSSPPTSANRAETFVDQNMIKRWYFPDLRRAYTEGLGDRVPLDWDGFEFKELVVTIESVLPNDARRAHVIRYLDSRLDPRIEAAWEQQAADHWLALERPHSSRDEAFLTVRADELARFYCNPLQAAYALDHLAHLVAESPDHLLSKLAARFGDERHCPAARLLIRTLAQARARPRRSGASGPP
jgi:uncharacterized protein YjbI with pentapeptide repeats